MVMPSAQCFTQPSKSNAGDCESTGGQADENLHFREQWTIEPLTIYQSYRGVHNGRIGDRYSKSRASPLIVIV